MGRIPSPSRHCPSHKLNAFHSLYLQQSDSTSSALLSVDGGGTYTLQQKNTSNALLLLAPTSSANTTAPTHERSVDGGLTAVSTLHETIELVIQAPDQLQKAKGKWHERFGRNR